jgi:hypothetical protein
MKKNLLLIIALIFTGFIVFSVIHNNSNVRHSVEFFSGSKFEGYENTEPSAVIDVSPAIAWQHTSGFLKALGWIFLAAMWVGFWYVATDRYLGKTNSRGGGDRAFLAYLVTIGPMILSIIFFLSAYSSGLTSNSVAVQRERFDGWLKSGVVEKRGEKTYVDADGSDTLKNLFIKPWIK